MTVIDLEANPPRVIDKVVIGDSPEEFAISPTGTLAVASLLNGNDAAKNAWYYNRSGKVVALKIDGNIRSRRASDAPVFDAEKTRISVVFRSPAPQPRRAKNRTNATSPAIIRRHLDGRDPNRVEGSCRPSPERVLIAMRRRYDASSKDVMKTACPGINAT